MQIRQSALYILVFCCFSPIQAAEYTAPNVFNAGEPAYAADVNENFDGAASAINDNHSRLSNVESSLTEVMDRLNVLEDRMPGMVTYNTYYGTDLVFFRDDGIFIVPYTGEPGQQSVPTPEDAILRNTAFEFNALPGLDSVSFEVEQDNTLVIFQTNGTAYNSAWYARTTLTVALSINGNQPEIGANERVTLIGDDTLAGDRRQWQINYATTLDAGTHTFSVLAQASSQNEANVSIDGRSTAGYNGRLKTSIFQIKMPE